MYYSMLVGLIFLSTVVCIDAMKDGSSDSGDNSQFIKIKLRKRTSSDKVKMAKSLPQVDIFPLAKSQPARFHKKNKK